MGTRYVFAGDQGGVDIDALATALDAEIGITAVAVTHVGGKIACVECTSTTDLAITDAATATGAVVDAAYPFVA